LISAHQNDLKTHKILIRSKEKNKIKILIFSKAFLKSKNKQLQNSIKKHIKTASQKLHFKLNFLMVSQYKIQFDLLPNNLLYLLHRKHKNSRKTNTVKKKKSLVADLKD
jgi:hypothetical protein